MNVGEHFMKLHQKSKPAKPMSPAGKECEPTVVGPSAKAYREVETFRKDDKSGSPPPGLGNDVKVRAGYKEEMGGKEIDAVTRFNAEPPGGDTPKSKEENEKVTSFRNVDEKCGMGNIIVICPMCESEVHGMDDGDLSHNLGRHLREAHKI